jgi:hypothetical protein
MENAWGKFIHARRASPYGIQKKHMAKIVANRREVGKIEA